MDIVSALQTSLAQLIGPSAIFYALLAIGLNLHFGYAGLLNFGQIGFALLGGYGVGIMTITYEQPLWLGIIVGLAAAGLLALVLGIPTLRLRADYLAIVTIAASEILRLVFGTSFRTYFHGKDGVTGFTAGFRSLNPLPDYDGFFLTYSREELWTVIVGWGLVIMISLLTWALMRSPWGRVLRGIREDEDAMRSLGKNV